MFIVDTLVCALICFIIIYFYIKLIDNINIKKVLVGGVLISVAFVLIGVSIKLLIGYLLAAAIYALLTEDTINEAVEPIIRGPIISNRAAENINNDTIIKQLELKLQNNTINSDELVLLSELKNNIQ